jgi:hypothetical protein
MGHLLVLGAVDLTSQPASSGWNDSHCLAVLAATSGQVTPPGWLDTTRLGWINIKSDGQQVWFETER